MKGQEKISRAIEFILLLNSDIGYTKSSIMEKLSISDSTFKRYLSNLRDIGFEVVKENKKYYKIDNDCSLLNSIKNSALLTENQKEMLKSISNIKGFTEEKQAELIEKLSNALESDHIIYSFITYDNLKLIKKIGEAIHNKKQIILRNYSSSNSSSIKNRRVEAFKFHNKFKAIWCYETDSQTKKNKLFKISRVEDVEILDENWQHTQSHKAEPTDIFDLSSEKLVPVEFDLSLKAMNLLVEETAIKKSDIQLIESGKYKVQTSLCSPEGFLRFYKGLSSEIKLINPNTIEKIIDKYKK
jgi:predicted DNA-binding transcriptional regulator YafY